MGDGRIRGVDQEYRTHISYCTCTSLVVRCAVQFLLILYSHAINCQVKHTEVPRNTQESSKYTEVPRKYTEVSSTYMEVPRKYTEVSSKYTEVSSKYTDVSSKYTEVSSKYTEVSNKHMDI